MVKKKSTAGKVPRKLDLNSVENETMERVERTLKNIDGFLSKWNKATTKPDDMFPQIMKIKKFHDALESWRRDAIKTKGKEKEDARMRRLQDFVLICDTYS